MSGDRNSVAKGIGKEEQSQQQNTERTAERRRKIVFAVKMNPRTSGKLGRFSSTEFHSSTRNSDPILFLVTD